LIPALHLLYFFWAQGRTLTGLFWTQGRTVESERNGTDWAKGRTEIFNRIGLLVWVGRRVEVEESCGIFFGWFYLGAPEEEVSKDGVLDCTRSHTVIRAPNTHEATECCGYLGDLFIH
jgi:hypothetical protein